ncbi:poly-beta-1,6-N-acetyl-D-glucosamine N-deacetylase PgaB [Seleniivibrio sp.]|uniref:poly-beta-1,6-N-acetyl-D-glucosamine N-deacetylase PgaB n=1 Tax=Seleniivibrio sp. TaxID=2898801 RepID=UPI0025F4C1C2|nr:poly-beta-1,6-N-acetyl-D-glucosamine N-deacetylase PgaB [Seleniivibrio sp.]MCD8554808.1 poly-beta-1,6-N-acetyl-D-glucosamine N-deacetylase PgaB [Seleniivibrio sp.]
MLIRFLIMTALLFSAGLSFSSEQNPKINGVQVFVLDKAYDGNLDVFFSGLKAKGYDTVFLRVFHNGSDRYHFNDENTDCKSGVYFKTYKACVVRDVLGEAVVSARRNGLKIYAWMATRSLTFLKTPEYIEKSFAVAGVVDGYGASIFDSVVRETLKGLFADLAKYDIDGVLFQDDFIMRYSEGASDEAVKMYESETCNKLTYDTLFGCQNDYKITKVSGACAETFLPWVRWKNGKLMDFFGELRDSAKAVDPDIKFAANVYYETPIDRAKGLSWYSQSIQSMLAAGFDYLAVMGYHDQIAAEMRKDTDEAVDVLYEMAENLVAATDDESRIILKLQITSFDKTRKVDEGQIKMLCRMTSDYPSISRVLVPVNSLEDVKDICFSN